MIIVGHDSSLNFGYVSEKYIYMSYYCFSFLNRIQSSPWNSSTYSFWVRCGATPSVMLFFRKSSVAPNINSGDFIFHDESYQSCYKMSRYNLLLCFVLAKDGVAYEEVAEGSNGHRNKLVPTVLEKFENLTIIIIGQKFVCDGHFCNMFCPFQT